MALSHPAAGIIDRENTSWAGLLQQPGGRHGADGSPFDEGNRTIAWLGNLLQHGDRLPGLSGQLREASQMKMNRSRYFIALLTSIAGLAFSGSATSTLAND